MPMYFQKLNLNVPFLIENFNISNIKRVSQFEPHTILHPELIKLIESSGEIRVVNCVILYYRPTSIPSPIHIDDDNVYDQTNFNLVFGGKDSKICWYETLNGYQGEVVNKLLALRRNYDINKIQLVESTNLEGACIFQAGVPHNVINNIDERWCISIKLKKKDSSWLDWNTAMQIFDAYY